MPLYWQQWRLTSTALNASPAITDAAQASSCIGRVPAATNINGDRRSARRAQIQPEEKRAAQGAPPTPRPPPSHSPRRPPPRRSNTAHGCSDALAGHARDAGWSLGPTSPLRELVAYWADGFDWPAQETALSRLPRFRVPLGGLGIHFVHIRAAAPAGPVLPLVLSHGWPDSFWRYAKVIPLLTDPGAHGADPSDAFDVVVPDMPGYGYSDRPTGPPLDALAVAGLWAELMGVLGYARSARRAGTSAAT